MSESLIDAVKRLAELESKPPYPYLVYVLPDMQTSAAGKTDADARFIHDMRMNAPKLLDVLGQFRAGDATWLKMIEEDFGRYPGYLNQEEINCLKRMQKMASLMEAECH